MSKVKIVFKLNQDVDGYPPFATESLWGQPTDSPDEFVIDNIPFFAREATVGDRVRVKRRGRIRYFEGVVTRAGHSLIRVIIFDDDRIPDVRRELSELGCSTEAFTQKPIVAVDIPPEIGVDDVRSYLDPLEKADVLTYEEPLLRHSS